VAALWWPPAAARDGSDVSGGNARTNLLLEAAARRPRGAVGRNFGRFSVAIFDLYRPSGHAKKASESAGQRLVADATIFQ